MLARNLMRAADEAHCARHAAAAHSPAAPRVPSVPVRHSFAPNVPLAWKRMKRTAGGSHARLGLSYRRARLLRISRELERWREVAATRSLSLTQPHMGWIRYIRDALNMNGFQLARRAGVRQPTVARLEQKERDGTITLRALGRVARALGCELVYALVPRTPLTTVVDEQVRRAVAAALRTAQRHAVDEEELARDLLVRMPRWIWGSWDYPQLYGDGGAAAAEQPERRASGNTGVDDG